MEQRAQNRCRNFSAIHFSADKKTQSAWDQRDAYDMDERGEIEKLAHGHEPSDAKKQARDRPPDSPTQTFPDCPARAKSPGNAWETRT